MFNGKKDTDFVNLGDIRINSYEAVVDNPHDFPVLLKLAVGEIWPGDAEFADIETRAWLSHEPDHYIPLLGVENVDVVYGVHFFKDLRTNQDSFIPFVKIGGQIQVGTFKDALNSVSKLSAGDKLLHLN